MLARETRGPSLAHDLGRGWLHAQRRLRHADRTTHQVANSWGWLLLSAPPLEYLTHGVILVTVIVSGMPISIARSRVNARQFELADANG